MNNIIKSRDTFPDSIRGMAIYLVVLGHFLDSFGGYKPAEYLYLVIYLFHMPLFVFMSGVFSKPILAEKDYTNIVKQLFLPLVVFNILYKLFVYFYPSGYGYGPLVPHSILWFLLSLIFWRVFLPLFRSATGLMLSVAMALAAGYFPAIGYDFSLARTVYFFPFFIIGSLYGRDILLSVKSHRLLYAAVFAVSVLIGLYWFQNGLYQHALYGSYGYTGKGIVIEDFPWLGRLLVMALSGAALISFCSLIPVQSSTLANLGVNSIAIYLLHQFFVLGLNGQGWRIIPNPSLRLLSFIVLSFVLCVVLSYAKPWIDKMINFIAWPFERINAAFR